MSIGQTRTDGTGPAISARDLTRTFTVRARPSTEGRPMRRLGLRRSRVQVTAVDAISFDVPRGEAVGYIGANGAGKSTTIKMLTGILVPSSGQVRTCGLDPVTQRRELTRRVGVVFGQRSQLWWDLPLAESLRILGAIHRLTPSALATRRDQLVDGLELASFLATPVRQLSLGQRMRGEVAAALLHRPDLVVLDEPTVGLDVLSKARLREFLRREQRESGSTVLLTTHDMGDVERLCSRVLVVDHGRLVYDGDLEGLTQRVGARRVLVVDLAEPAPPLERIPGTTLVDSEGGGLRQRLAFSPTDPLAPTTAPAVLAAVTERGVTVVDMSIEEPDAEDVVRRLYLGFDRS